MSAQGIYAIQFLDQKGKIILQRDYRGECCAFIIDKFQSKVLELDEQLIKPVFTEKDKTYIWIRVNNIYLVSVAKWYPNVSMVMSFLFKIRDVFVSYYKELEDECLRDNFVITYEVFDEMMDCGYTQITEVKVLQEFNKTEANKMSKQVMGGNKNRQQDQTTNLAVPTAASNVVILRTDGIKNQKNEIFLYVIEKLNILVF